MLFRLNRVIKSAMLMAFGSGFLGCNQSEGQYTQGGRQGHRQRQEMGTCARLLVATRPLTCRFFRPLPQWISGAGDPRNKIHILIGLSDPENPSPHKRHTIVLIPPSTPGVKVVRPLKVFGYDDAPEGHCEVVYDNVVLDEKECLVGGWGRGFEVSARIRSRLLEG